MAEVSNIAAGFNPPDPLKTMGNLVSTVKGIQDYQTGQIQQQRQGVGLQSDQQVLQQQQIATQVQQQANKERQIAMQIVPKFMQPDGTFDAPGLMNALAQAGVQQTLPDIQGKIAETNGKQISANTAMLGLDKDKMVLVNNAIGDMSGKPASEIAKRLDTLEGQVPEIGPQAEMVRHQISLVNKEDSNAQTAIDGIVSRAKGIGNTLLQKKTLEEPSVASTGGTLISTSPEWATGKQQFGKVANATLPPSTPIVNTKGGKSYLGAPGLEAELPPGTHESMVGTVAEMNRHYASLNDVSTGAPLVNALTGNIKALAQKAITGTDADRRSYVNGLLNALGAGDKTTGDLQKDTDLLEKQLSQLNLSTPAASDAARNLVKAARPHSSMAPTAIPEAADQVASQVEANMAIRNYLTPARYNNDQNAYQQSRNTIEKIADPRAWQYIRLGPGTPAAKQFLAGLKPDDRADLIKKAGVLDSMGMLK